MRAQKFLEAHLQFRDSGLVHWRNTWRPIAQMTMMGRRFRLHGSTAVRPETIPAPALNILAASSRARRELMDRWKTRLVSKVLELSKHSEKRSYIPGPETARRLWLETRHKVSTDFAELPTSSDL
jgi:hypothetical protein